MGAAGGGADRPVVAVIGAGPVGQTAALLLARWGLDVVMVDARPRRELAGSKAICQQRDVLDVWACLGASAIAEEGVSWTTARTYYQRDELFAWSFVDRSSSHFPPFVNISQSRTEEILDGCIAANPGIEVRWGHEVTGIDQDGRGVTLTCEGPAGTSVLRALYAVACSGAGGDAVRAMLGVSFDGQTFGDRFLICDIRAELPGWRSERRFYFDPVWNPGRQVLIHPCPDSAYRIDWQVPPDFDLESEERTGALDRRIRRIVGQDRPYELIWRSVYRFHSRIVDRMRVGRVLIAGDAAHLVAPFGARGLNSGVPDAENAAWKIAFAAQGWAPDALLESYHAERHAAALENLDVTSATMRFMAPQDEAERRRRTEVLERARGDAKARAEVDSGRLAEPFWYVDSPLTTADPRRPFGGRPERGTTPPPGPGILVPDVPVRVAGRPEIGRLRELARTGVLVLTAEGTGVPVIAEAVTRATPAPATVLAAADADGSLTGALGMRAGEVWVVRPDAHVAATLADAGPGDVAAAIRRLLGHTGVRD